MTKFKVGDEVRIVSAKNDWKKQYIGCTFVITENEGCYDGEPSWSSLDRKSFGYRWKESELELVSPKRFEVGKRYRLKHSTRTILVEYILSNGSAVGVDSKGSGIILHTFSNYEEVKPEDWRCLFYDKTTEIPSLGGVSYATEAAAIEWGKLNKCFIKAVRVDA